MGCTNNSINDGCAPVFVSIEETKDIVINGKNGTLMDDVYIGIKNIWWNTSNEKEYLVFVTDNDFVWIRVDEEGYGYSYGGEYSYDEDTLHLVVYANNEIVEEYYYEYWFEGTMDRVLILKDQDGNKTVYEVRKAYPIKEES